MFPSIFARGFRARGKSAALNCQRQAFRTETPISGPFVCAHLFYVAKLLSLQAVQRFVVAG